MRLRRSSAACGERANSSTPDTALSAHQQPSAVHIIGTQACMDA